MGDQTLAGRSGAFERPDASMARCRRACTTRRGEVAAAAFEHGAQRVERATQSTGERVGEVDDHRARRRSRPSGRSSSSPGPARRHAAGRAGAVATRSRPRRHPSSTRPARRARSAADGTGVAAHQAIVTRASTYSFSASWRKPACCSAGNPSSARLRGAERDPRSSSARRPAVSISRRWTALMAEPASWIVRRHDAERDLPSGVGRGELADDLADDGARAEAGARLGPVGHRAAGQRATVERCAPARPDGRAPASGRSPARAGFAARRGASSSRPR